MSIHIRAALPEDSSAISELVQASFCEYVAPDWDKEAQAHFMEQSSSERIAGLIPDAAFSAVALTGATVMGFIHLTAPTQLDFLFVNRSAVRQHIGSLLWHAARSHIESIYPLVKTVELNSSPYAVAAYRSLGFYPISEPFRRGGCLATRMACWLPGKALAKRNAA